MRGLAEAELALGHAAAARSIHEQVLALRAKFWGREHWEVAQSLVDLADLAAKQRDATAEGRFRREALALRCAVLAPSHPDVARSVLALGHFLCAHHEPGEGAALLAEGLILAVGAPALAGDADRAKAALSACAPGALAASGSSNSR